MTQEINYQVGMNGDTLSWVGTVKLDFGKDVQKIYTLPSTTFDELKDKTEDERKTFAANLAIVLLADKQEFLDQLQFAVDNGLYGTQQI